MSRFAPRSARPLLAVAGLSSALAGVGGAPSTAAALAPRSPGARGPASAAMAADTTVRMRFDIPAQALASALAAFSRQTGIRILVEAAAAANVRSAAVSANVTAAEGLRRLLAGTELVARFSDAQTAVVARPGSREPVAQSLAQVTVTSAPSGHGYAALRTTTATKTDTPLRDTPQAVTVISRDLIADQAMQGMADVVRYVPGVTMSPGEGNRDAPTIRGNSTTADFFVDGVRDDAQYFRDVYNLDRVEALKGSNAMIFGRGGGGGVLNRVTKEAQWAPVRTLSAAGGSFDHRRATLDAGQALTSTVAARLNGVYENSRAFRDGVGLERYGVTPTVAAALGARTMLRAGYEYFSDDRTADRGIPGYQGRPLDTDIATFFGDPTQSTSRAHVHSGVATLEHAAASGLTVRNRTRYADYDKFYQNVFPGAVNAAGTQVSIAAYNLATRRGNLFNQTDLTYRTTIGTIGHTLLLGGEIGRQRTDNFRSTGYFNNTATSFAAPLAQPTIAVPVTFRQSATDADNRTTATVAAVYVQDQIALLPQVQAVLGVRYDRFRVDFHNNRTSDDLDRGDDLVSPRAGLVFKPAEPVSFYGTYSVSYLPSSGDQFSSLTATTRTLKPEQFRNYELGAKWDVRSRLALTAAAYRLDRTNTTAPDPNNPALVVQTGSQRTTGLELGASGNVTAAWQVAGGFASQRARIVSRTAAAFPGATVPLVPHRTFSLWNRYRLAPALGLGVGVVRQSDMYAAVDNTVTLPSFTRADAAAFVRLTRNLRGQVNVENLFDERYYVTAHSNSNISPGSARSVRVSLTAGL